MVQFGVTRKVLLCTLQECQNIPFDSPLVTTQADCSKILPAKVTKNTNICSVKRSRRIGTVESRHQFTSAWMKPNHTGKYWNCFGDKSTPSTCLADLTSASAKSENDFEAFPLKYEVWDTFNRPKTSLPDYKRDNCGGFITSKTEPYKSAWKWDQKCKLYNLPRWRNQKQIGFQANKQVINQTWNAAFNSKMNVI